MIKTYITALLVVLFATAPSGWAQESLDDVFAQLDAAEEQAPPAEVESAPSVDVVPETTESPAADTIEAVPNTPVEPTDLYERGRAYYRAGDYKSAEATFEAMLAINPLDTKAMNALQQTVNRISRLEEKRLVTDRKQAMKDVAEGWSKASDATIAVEEPGEEGGSDADVLAIQQMEARVRNIIIPRLDFLDASMMDVVLSLSETCRRLDPQSKGVNILLLGMNGSSGAEESNVTISIRDMSLYDVLGFVMQMANLRFEIKPNAIAIMPVDYVATIDLVSASHTVSPEVADSLMSSAASGGDEGGDDDSDSLFGDTDSFSSGSASGGPMDVSSFFSTIDFPEGAVAEYHSNLRKLFVKNTKGNLRAIKGFLAEMEDEAGRLRSQQVEIETKFVEFNEGAYEELGFDWTVYGSGDVGGFEFKEGSYFQKTSGFFDQSATVPTVPSPIYLNPVSGYSEIQGSRPGQNLFGASQRPGSAAFEAVTSGLLSSMGGTPAAMVFGNGDVDVRISAMEQEGTADVLFAPRVTTKSGTDAVIRVVEVHRYPQDWEVETGQKTAPVIKPMDWEDFDLGVVLTVTPMVNAESNTIDLDLQPEVTRFRGFDEYKVGSNAFDVSGNNSTEPTTVGDNTPLIVKMPYFEKRAIQTQVTLADGFTLMMGGLVNERTETFSDRVPFLGSIPYLGRLFRSEGSRSEKRNLTIFVKARQVDDKGRGRADRG